MIAARRACAKTCVEHRADLALGGREAGHLGVGRVDEEQVDALFAEPGERAQVGEPAVERQLVHLEVAGVQHEAGRRADRDGERVGDRVVDRDELEVERAERRSCRPRSTVERVRLDAGAPCSFASTSARVSLEPISGMSGLQLAAGTARRRCGPRGRG